MAEDGQTPSGTNIEEQASHLAAVLKEMKQCLDLVRSKVKDITAKVKMNAFPTSDGISYLQTKYMLLISYCQSLVYYVLRKGEGLRIEGHPVVNSLIEIRLYLEKIRPIDRKMEYQIQKLIRHATREKEETIMEEKKSSKSNESEDLLKYRPNPDLLLAKSNDEGEQETDVYRPPRIAPTAMDDDGVGKREREAKRREKLTMRQSKRGFAKELVDNLEGRPEEITEDYGNDSREFEQYRNQWEARAKREEELFTRVPFSKEEKRKQKKLTNSRNGFRGLTDGFYDEIKGLPIDDDETGEQMRKSNKRKRQRK